MGRRLRVRTPDRVRESPVPLEDDEEDGQEGYRRHGAAHDA